MIFGIVFSVDNLVPAITKGTTLYVKMSLFLPLCFVALIGFQLADGFGTGAPDSRCGATAGMVPEHGTPPQTEQIPFILSAENGQTTYTTGEIISLTLEGDRTFTGFLIQALSSSGAIVGKMIAPPGGQSKLLNCGNIGRNGITHTSNLAKSSFTFQWEGPDTETNGAVTFLVTVVENYSTFWVKQFLLTLTASEVETPTTTVQQETGETTNLSPTVTPLAQTTVVSSSASTPLIKPISQVTTNNLLHNASTRVTRIDIYTAHNDGFNATISQTYNNTFENNGILDARKNVSSFSSAIYNSSLYPTTVAYNLNESNEIITSSNDPRIYTKNKIITNYDNTNYSDPTIENEFVNTMPIYETTPSVSDSGRSFDTVDNVQQFTVGQYVNVNHRTKASDSNMPVTTHRDLSPFDKGFENLNQILAKEANDTFESLNVPTSQFNELNLNSINQNNSDQINELHRWTDNYNRINWTRTDLNDNYENASLDEPQTTTNHGLGNNLKDTWSQSLRITELPLSDPDRIFNVAKEILLKDRNHVVTFRELIKPLEFSGNKLTLNDVKTDDKANSFPQNSYQFTTETDGKAQDIHISTKPFIGETTPMSVKNRHLSEMVTENNNNDINRKVKDQHSDSVKETKIPEIDITTTQSSVTIESGLRSTTLKEIVNKWMREHIHDVPDPVSTATSNEPEKSKINDEQSSNQNDTNTFKHLDSRYPKLEVKCRLSFGNGIMHEHLEIKEHKPSA